jgi:hypothetical protein
MKYDWDVSGIFEKYVSVPVQGEVKTVTVWGGGPGASAAGVGKTSDIPLLKSVVIDSDTLQIVSHISSSEEQPGRESVVTDSEKAADQMVKDIMSDKIDRTGRQAVRKALDQKDAPLVGRAKEDAALGNISRRG